MKENNADRQREFARRLESARKKAGLTQTQAARLLGITQPNLSKIENGQIRIDVFQLVDFARAYGADSRYFLAGMMEEPSSSWHEHISAEAGTVADSSPHLITLLDAGGRCRYVNARSMEMLGYPPRQFEGRKFSSFMREDSAAELDAALSAGRPARMDVCVRRADGAFLAAELHLQPQSSDGNIRFACVMRDRTQLQEAELRAKRRLQAERFLADLAISFVRVRYDYFSTEVESALARINTFMGSRDAFLHIHNEDFLKLEKSYFHSFVPGSTMPLASEPDTLLPTVDWCSSRLKKGIPILCPDLSALPSQASAEKKIAAKAGIKAMYLIPVSINRSVRGVLGIGFDFVQPPLPEAESEFLSRLSEIFSQLFSRLNICAESHSRYQALQIALKNSCDTVTIRDLDGRITYCSQPEYFSVPIEKVMGVEPEKLLTPAGVRELRHRIADAVNTGRETASEYRVVIDGSAYEMRGIFAPLREEGGRITAVVAQERVSEPCRASQKEQEAVSNLLTLLSLSRNFKDTLRSAAMLFREVSSCEAVGIRVASDGDYTFSVHCGYGREFALGEKDVFSGAGSCGSRRQCICGTVVSGVSCPGMRKYFSSHGTFWTNDLPEMMSSCSGQPGLPPMRDACVALGVKSLAVVPLKCGGRMLGAVHVAGFTGGAFSAGSIKLLERMADHLAVWMENYNSRRQLESAHSSAQKANHMKNHFIAHLSHEVRNHTGTLFTVADLLESTRLTARQKEDVRLLRDTSTSLDSLLADMLDLSLIEAGKLAINETSFTLAHMCSGLETAVRPLLGKKALRFSISVAPGFPQVLLGDEVRVRQILMNLLGNAVKYTSKGSVKLDISMRDAKPDGSFTAVFAVSDTGIGVARENLDVIFEDFSRVDKSSSSFSGCGIGLFMARRLARLMNGDVTAESEPGRGSVFTAALSIRKAP